MGAGLEHDVTVEGDLHAARREEELGSTALLEKKRAAIRLGVGETAKDLEAALLILEDGPAGK